MSVISSACSPVSGRETSSASVSTPSPRRTRGRARAGVDERGDAAGLVRIAAHPWSATRRVGVIVRLFATKLCVDGRTTSRFGRRLGSSTVMDVTR